MKGLTLTSNPRAKALMKSAPFWICPTSWVCLEVCKSRRKKLKKEERKSQLFAFELPSPSLLPTDLYLDTLPLYVHPNLQACHLDQRSIDVDPLLLQRSHPVTRNHHSSELVLLVENLSGSWEGGERREGRVEGGGGRRHQVRRRSVGSGVDHEIVVVVVGVGSIHGSRLLGGEEGRRLGGVGRGFRRARLRGGGHGA